MAEQRSKKCFSIFEAISDYVDGELDEVLCSEIETHLKHCNDCDNFIESVKKTIALYRSDSTPMPAEMKNSLHIALEAKCRELKNQKQA